MQDAELQQLIAGCLKQDKKDQKRLYQQFYAYAMAICLRYAANPYEATEILNQGFFNVFTKIDQYDPDKLFKSWLGRIMTNAAIDHYRSNLKFSRTDDLEKAEYINNNDSSDNRLEYKDLLAMIQRLPDAYRTVFMLCAIDGYTHEEIGDLLGITPGTSRSNLFKARTKLKIMLSRENEVSEQQQTLLQLVRQKTGQLKLVSTLGLSLDL